MIKTEIIWNDEGTRPINVKDGLLMWRNGWNKSGTSRNGTRCFYFRKWVSQKGNTTFTDFKDPRQNSPKDCEKCPSRFDCKIVKST